MLHSRCVIGYFSSIGTSFDATCFGVTGTDVSGSAVHRLQDKYDITKHVSLDAVLQLVRLIG